MKVLLLAFFATAVLAGPTLRKVRYDGHKVIQVQPKTQQQVEALQQMQEYTHLGMDFWTQPNTHIPVDIHVPPQSLATVVQLLEKEGLTHKLLTGNLQSMMDAEEHSNLRAKRQNNWWENTWGTNGNNGGSKGNSGSKGIVGTYARFDAVNSWLEGMASQYSTIASIQSIGETYQGRNMKIIKIGRPGSNKPAMWIDSGIHAREWISPATAIWIINEMLSKYGRDTEVTNLVNTYDWYILPVANPDGYEYSHMYERLWRKTRSRNSGSSCYGTDPNRNWDFYWGGASTSSNPCSDIFKGRAPFSESCTGNMRNFINQIKGNLKMYLSIHSYSQLWLTPWGYTSSRPRDYVEIDRVANAGANALYNVNRVRFQVGTPPSILYAAAGGSYDWAMGVAGVKYSYTLELRPSGSAFQGFVIDASNIVPSGEEVWAGIKAVANEIR